MKLYALLALTLVVPALSGCGDSVNNAPPAAAMTPHNDAPPKIPTTLEEKIAANEKAPMPAEQKKQEIARIRAGG